jgi:hypothetical protein
MLPQLEKVRVAMSTLAPKAMTEPITLFLRLTKDARTAPAISGKLAIKPQSRESNMVPVDEVNYIFAINCWRAVNIETMMSSVI